MNILTPFGYLIVFTLTFIFLGLSTETYYTILALGVLSSLILVSTFFIIFLFTLEKIISSIHGKYDRYNTHNSNLSENTLIILFYLQNLMSLLAILIAIIPTLYIWISLPSFEDQGWLIRYFFQHLDK